MDELFDALTKSVSHLRALNSIFQQGSNFEGEDALDYLIYDSNLKSLKETIDQLDLDSQLYARKERQMILADLIEYILIGRGYYALKSKEDRQKFIRLVLHFVNLLMCYEMMTVSDNIRRKFLDKVARDVKEIEREDYYTELQGFAGKVGLTAKETDAPKNLNKYFDSLLPKTAGGLWHELLVYVFLIRTDMGYVIPLLLSQRLIGREGSLIPPDFLVITYDKNLYGIEVGIKKEIQSGSFSLQSNIPTATIDTINSRSSDRCPICKRWIPFCELVIRNYSDFNKEIDGFEVRCLAECDVYSKEKILNGDCPYTKYSRSQAPTLEHTHHEFADGLHYHYKCVLNKVPPNVRRMLAAAEDTIALKTHYPYYSGLEALKRNAT
ncbi:MAG: hypothetical protein JXB43_10385 [Dehalococcoidia bacterium]|nr:hypothetical protein [Dehalococcoidia bacterium]